MRRPESPDDQLNRRTLLRGAAALGLTSAAGIRSLRDLKGKTIGIVPGFAVDGIFLGTTLANVGIDLRKDVKIVSYQPGQAAELLSSRRVDALAAFPPIAQDLLARRIGT